MATGPEHHQLAEVAQQAAAAIQGDELSYTATEALLDALVHATLALAAQNVPPPVIVHVEGDVKPEQLRRLINEANREAVQRHPGVVQ